MDSNVVETNEEITEANNQSELSENTFQSQCESVNEPKSEQNEQSTLGSYPEMPNDDISEDIVLVSEDPPIISSTVDQVNEHVAESKIGDISDNTHVGSIQASDAAMTDDTEEVKEIIDIDEILSTIHGGDMLQSADEDETPTASEQGKEEENTGDQGQSEDIVLLSDGESETKEDNLYMPLGTGESSSVTTELIENTDIDKTDQLNLNIIEPQTDEVIEIKPAHADDIQISDPKAPENECRTNKDIADAVECIKSIETTEPAVFVEQNKEIINDEQQSEDTVSESCNIMDLLLENQDLFGQVGEETSETQTNNETQRNELDSNIEIIDEEVNEEKSHLDKDNEKSSKIVGDKTGEKIEKSDSETEKRIEESGDIIDEKMNENAEKSTLGNENDVEVVCSEINDEKKNEEVEKSDFDIGKPNVECIESDKDEKDKKIGKSDSEIEEHNMEFSENLDEKMDEDAKKSSLGKENDVEVVCSEINNEKKNEEVEKTDLESESPNVECNESDTEGKDKEDGKSNSNLKCSENLNEKMNEDTEKSSLGKENDVEMVCSDFNDGKLSGEVEKSDLSADNELCMENVDGNKDEESEHDNEEFAEAIETPVEVEPIQHDDELAESVVKPAVRRECLNADCSKDCENFFEAPEFVINHFHLSKRPKMSYVCEKCYDMVTESYGELCAALEDKQPLLLKETKHNDLVEIIDSSDDEDDAEMGESDEKHEFDMDTLKLIENELEAVIEEKLKQVDIDQQMDWNRQVLKAKIDSNEKNCAEMMNEMRTLQSRIDKLYSSTYNFRHNFIEEVQSLDLTTLKPTQICNETYPPAGGLKYQEIQYNTLYYTFRSQLISSWQPCKVVQKVQVDGHTEYEVKFCRSKKETASTKTVARKHLAYGRPPDVRLNIGTRVIALFDYAEVGGSVMNRAGQRMKNSFYPGVIAEPLSFYTHWRYLVFFDDGWVQYVYHENVRVICEATENVWELIEEPGAKKFIEGYVRDCKSKRPIVQLRNGQRIQTESGGKWYNGVVAKVDGSLVQIFFEDLNRHEWIYRGSKRLFPLYKKLKATATSKATSTNRNEASIEYIVIDDDKQPERSTEPPVEESPPTTTPTPAKSMPIQRTFASQAARDTPQQKQREQKRAVAKKSTAPQPKPAITHMNNSTIYVDEDKPKGKVVYYTAKKHIDVKKYIHHDCSPSCLIQVSHNLSIYSPLSKPLLSGFERQISKTRVNKKFVVYRGPCGRRFRDMYELHEYLRITDSKLNVDNFTFDPLIHCLAEYVIDSYVMKKADLSEGVEKMPVQLINCYDNSMPPSCKYSAKRIPTEGVDLNLNPEFLCGCDCTDDCLDKSKCACWQLTLQGAKYGNPDTPIEDVGYEYKRLNEPVPTGIYECNAQCKCKSSCLNRVVQHPIQLKLQVFKTVNRGWGLRCLNDVPKGSFICCYAGNLLTETAANEAGEDLGDEYFAELDYIEVVENMKEGYEPEVINDDPESSETDEDFDVEKEIRSRNDDSDDEFVAKKYSTSEDSESRRYRTRNSVDTQKNPIQRSPTKVPPDTGCDTPTEKMKERGSSSDEEGEGTRQVKNFMAGEMPLNDGTDDERGKSIRQFFGKNEAVYIMDAKKAGNIGRYFNHSCGPNLFVQNVFVDTHDLRFPWVAFFASTHIRAGTELTWNYNYEVGSVPGKVLICQCGDEKCRGRIL